MDKQIELIAPNVFLASSLLYYIVEGGKDSINGLAIATFMWILVFALKRIYPLEKPTELQKQVDGLKTTLEKLAAKLDYKFNENDLNFSREISSIKSALHMHQIGR